MLDRAFKRAYIAKRITQRASAPIDRSGAHLAMSAKELYRVHAEVMLVQANLIGTRTEASFCIRRADF